MASTPPPPVHTRPIADGHLLPSSATINHHHHHQPAACLRRSGAGGQQEKLIQERTTRTTSERRNCGTSKVTPFTASLNLFLPTMPSSSQTREYAFARSLSSKQSLSWNFNGQESLDVRHSGAALTDCHAMLCHCNPVLVVRHFKQLGSAPVWSAVCTGMHKVCHVKSVKKLL